MMVLKVSEGAADIRVPFGTVRSWNLMRDRTLPSTRSNVAIPAAFVPRRASRARWPPPGGS